MKRDAKTPTFVGAFVPGTGIEPALPCDNQILSLTRLPVPPSGQRWNEAAEKAGRNITDLGLTGQNSVSTKICSTF
jgi:hypothetical protein